MIRRWRRGLVLAAVGAAAIVGGILLAMEPWSGDTLVEEAAGQVSEYSLCNVSISNVPADVMVGARERLVAPGEKKIYLVVYAPILTEGLPAATPGVTPTPVEGRMISELFDDEGGWIESHVVFDAQTGDVVEEYYNPAHPADKVKLGAVKSSLIVGPPSPATSAWPRTDTQPTTEKIELAVPEGFKGLKYRPPEAGSGMLVSPIQGQPYGQRLVARTCESRLVIDIDQNGKGRIVVDDVAPEEQAMFDRFLNEVDGLQR